MSPSPFHILRTHSAPIHHVAFSSSNTLLYAGDENGFVSVTDLRRRRVVAHWRAHDGGVLGVGEWEGGVVSHGRDNLILFHSPLSHLSSQPHSETGISPLLDPPIVLHQLDVNALNFCRFSLVEVPGSKGGKGKGRDGLIAVPALTDSEKIDIYHLPTLHRLHASLNTLPIPAPSPAGSDKPRTGLVMSTHLHLTPEGVLRSVIAYEDGRVELWELVGVDEPSKTGETGVNGVEEGERDGERGEVWRRKTNLRLGLKEGAEWRKVWGEKVHNEAVMAMTVSPTLTHAFSISADHLLVRYPLPSPTPALSSTPEPPLEASTKQIGNSSLSVSPSGRVVAVGGWDGRVRLFSAKTLKPLGGLGYHREGVQSLCFPNSVRRGLEEDEGEGEEVGVEGVEEVQEVRDVDDQEEGGEGLDGVERWLISGGKDRRIALWELKDFERSK